MATEIERKFLVRDETWRCQAVRSERLLDGLLATSKGRKVRIRLYGDRATIAIKTRKKGRVRFEFEYEIPIADAHHILASECGRSVLGKTRHYVPFEGHTWEIDVYEAPLDGVVLAEIELASENQNPPLPPWAGREVTEDPAFRKTHLFADRAQRKFRVTKHATTKRKAPRPQPRRGRRSVKASKGESSPAEPVTSK
jgi:adenylate cyclase